MASFDDNPKKWFVDKIVAVFSIAALFIVGVYAAPYFTPLLMDIVQGGSVGQYHKETQTILVFPEDRSVDDIFFTLSHEMGHYVWNERLTVDQRIEWERIHDVSPDDEFFVNGFTGDYSRSSPEEDFAQTFASMFEVEYSVANIQRYSESRVRFFEDQGILALMDTE